MPINMEDLEEKIKALEESIKEVKKFKGGENYSHFGERIIECIRGENYAEAGLVKECFELATRQMPISIEKEGFPVLGKYISATVAVLGSLPQDEVRRGISELYDD